MKSATKVYENSTDRKATHTVTTQKGKAYAITINEFNGSFDITVSYTGCEVLCNNRIVLKTTHYPATLTAVVVATGASITITMNGVVDYQATMVHELN